MAMSIVERVEALLRDYEGAACCDDHVVKRLGLTREQAQRAIYSIMAKNNKDFRRSKGYAFNALTMTVRLKTKTKK